MRYLREEKPEHGLFRMLYDLMNQLGSYPNPPYVGGDGPGFFFDPPVGGDGPGFPPVGGDGPGFPPTEVSNPRFNVSRGNWPQPPTIVDPRTTPPPPSFNVSQGNEPQPPTIVDPRRPQPSPGMFSPETARSVDLVRQAMLRGGFNRRR